MADVVGGGGGDGGMGDGAISICFLSFFPFACDKSNKTLLSWSTNRSDDFSSCMVLPDDEWVMTLGSGSPFPILLFSRSPRKAKACFLVKQGWD